MCIIIGDVHSITRTKFSLALRQMRDIIVRLGGNALALNWRRTVILDSAIKGLVVCNEKEVPLGTLLKLPYQFNSSDIKMNSKYIFKKDIFK